jgi:hypothetical protein
MRKLLFFLAILPLLSACSATKDVQSSRAEMRKDKKIAEQAIVKKAVESRSYIIKLDRMYLMHGGIVNLYPRVNFIIIDGNKAVISTAYFGRQYDIRPIAGISMYGRPTDYELTYNISKGIYEVHSVIKNDSNSFDLYLTIGKGGNCTVSFNNMKLDYVSYKGYLVPVKKKVTMPLQDIGVI